MRSTIAAATVALTLAVCHQPEQPRVPPPPAPPNTPTNPTISLGRKRTIASEKKETIDASIVSDGGAVHDARVFDLDAGSSR
jgi:hypothetical protein